MCIEQSLVIFQHSLNRQEKTMLIEDEDPADENEELRIRNGEVNRVSKVILKLDDDNATRMNNKKVNEWRYRLEGHIFFDDAWEDVVEEGVEKRQPNEYFHVFFDLLNKMTGKKLNEEGKMETRKLVNTPYGDKLVVKRPSGTLRAFEGYLRSDCVRDGPRVNVAIHRDNSRNLLLYGYGCGFDEEGIPADFVSGEGKKRGETPADGEEGGEDGVRVEEYREWSGCERDSGWQEEERDTHRLNTMIRAFQKIKNLYEYGVTIQTNTKADDERIMMNARLMINSILPLHFFRGSIIGTHIFQQRHAADGYMRLRRSGLWQRDLQTSEGTTGQENAAECAVE
ncbi:hypothetical protein CRE_25635 [Caenorhabditis remanei]|uniref:Uncharacterized protein n=1 Tax=Caenorhabditis remanei TaxID=31234 RepID=E3ML52_CAERE|nr:hypothetical protein CRE_25635 [Caenorhabditis remanei]